jgi:hypothetical protein
MDLGWRHAADQHGVEPERGLVDDGRQGLALAERADAAADVAGGALGVRGLGHHRLAPARGRGQRLEVEGAAHRHQGDGQRAVHPGHQRLEQPPGVDAERGGGGLAVALLGRVVGVVGMQRVGHPGPLQHLHRRGRRHGDGA